MLTRLEMILEPDSELYMAHVTFGSGEPLEHDTYHCELGEAFGDEGEGFVVSHQTSIASEPGQRPFDYPSPAYDLEAALVVGALDDFQLDRLARERCFKLRPSIAAVGEDFGDPWEQMARLADQTGSAVAVLDIGWDHRDAEKQPDRVDDDIALDALGFLCRVVSDRIPLRPLFSVAFTAVYR